MQFATAKTAIDPTKKRRGPSRHEGVFVVAAFRYGGAPSAFNFVLSKPERQGQGFGRNAVRL